MTLDPLPPRVPGEGGVPLGKEPFGFIDGVSQPIIKGTRRWMRQSDAIHSVEPGEFLLGYPDNRGFFPPSPSVPASADPGGLLPITVPKQARETVQPDFAVSLAGTARDFGRNGTFLVIRQLEQNVDAFTSYIAGAARQCQDHPAVPDAIVTEAER